MYMYMYIGVYMYMYTYMYIYIYIYTYVHVMVRWGSRLHTRWSAGVRCASARAEYVVKVAVITVCWSYELHDIHYMPHTVIIYITCHTL